MTIAVVLRLYPVFVRVVFPCAGLKGVEILAKHPISLGGYKCWRGINSARGVYIFSGGGGGYLIRSGNPHMCTSNSNTIPKPNGKLTPT